MSSYKPIPGGYLDRQALNRAQRANHEARRNIQRILEETPGPMRLWQLLARVAHALGENLDALIEMERIRRELDKAGENNE